MSITNSLREIEDDTAIPFDTATRRILNRCFSLIDPDRNLWCPPYPRSFQTTVSRIPWVLHSRQRPGAQVQQLERAFGGTRHEGSKRMGRMDYYYKCPCVCVGRAGERLSVNVEGWIGS